MPTPLRAEWTGLREYRDSLKKMPPEAMAEIDHVIYEGMLVGLQIALSRAPFRTGRLIQSLRVARPSKFRVTMEAGVPYAIYVEFGTSRMRAQPFLRPGIESAMQYIRDVLQRRIADALKRATK